MRGLSFRQGWAHTMEMLLLLLWACRPEPVVFCDGMVQMWYEPDPSGELTVFPDDHWTELADTPTGLQVALHPADLPMLADYPENFVGIFEEISTLDGFGLSSGIWMRAQGTLPEISEDQVVLWADGRRWPVELKISDGGQSVIIWPRFPLPEATQVTAVLLTDPNDAQCVAPSAYTKSLLDPSVEQPPIRSSVYQAALADLGIGPERVAGMTLFTTQSATRISKLVAEDILTRVPVLEAGGCAVMGGYRECNFNVIVQDYRAESHIVPADSQGTPMGSYALPVRVWLPEGLGPFPTVLCGHGLGGDKGQCALMADNAAPLGIAVVAVDAVEHGEHPGRSDPGIDFLADFMIFGISLTPPGLDALRLRDNFHQSAWDKLQVIQAIRQGLDVDGDGLVDLDGQKLSYVGVSLGAIMGPEVLAQSEMDGAVLVVGGGRMSRLIQDSDSFSILVDVMRPAGISDGDVDRFFPLLQTVIDPADPMIWGGQMPEQNVLAMLAYQDTVIPNSSNGDFVRALGVPGVGSQVWEIPNVAFVQAPVSGNLPGGHTGGIVEYAEVQMSEGGEWVAADHSYLHESVQGMGQILMFLGPVMQEALPVIVEPERP